MSEFYWTRDKNGRRTYVMLSNGHLTYVNLGWRPATDFFDGPFTSVHLTPDEARELGEALLKAAAAALDGAESEAAPDQRRP